MRGSILTDGNPGVTTDNLYIKPGVGNQVADLIVDPAGSKNSEGAGKGYFAGSSQPGSGADQIAYPTLKTIGEALANPAE